MRSSADSDNQQVAAVTKPPQHLCHLSSRQRRSLTGSRGMRDTGIATTQSSKRGNAKEQLGESTVECVAATTTITTTTEPTRRRGKMKRCGHSPD